MTVQRTLYLAGATKCPTAFPTIAGHPLSAVPTVCGAEVANTIVGDDNADGLTSTTPALTLQGLCLGAGPTRAGLGTAPGVDVDVVYGCGVLREDDSIVNLIDLLDKGGIEFRQWPGMPTFIIDASTAAGTAGWSASGNGFIKTITTGLSIIAVWGDFHDTANITAVSGSETGGRRKAALVKPTSLGVYNRGTWVGSRAYAVGDSVRDTTGNVTYICVTAHTSGGALPISTNADVAKWESYATQKTAALAAGTTLVGKWAYDWFSGELAVGLPGAKTPSVPTADGVSYTVKGRNQARFDSTTNDDWTNANIVFYGVWFRRNPETTSTSPAGANIYITNGVSCRVQNCVFEESGLKAYTFGSKCLNNVCSGNVINGIAAGGYAMTFNASGTTLAVTNAASGCRVNDTLWDLHSQLGHNGVTIDRSRTISGAYVHGLHTDVEIKVTEMRCMVPLSGSPDAVALWNGSDGVDPGAGKMVGLYPYRVVDTLVTNASYQPDQGVTVSIGVRNVVFQGTQQNALSNGHLFEYTSLTGRIRIEGSAIVGNLANGNGAAVASLFKIGAAAKLERLNCSLYDAAATHSDGHTYAVDYEAAAGAIVTDSGSILAFRNVTDKTGGGAIATATFQVVTGEPADATKIAYLNDMYSNITKWGDRAAWDTAAEWLSAVDTGQVDLLTVNPFADATGASLEPTAGVKGTKRHITPHTDKGFNGLGYGDLFGGWQPGGLPAKTTIGIIDGINAGGSGPFDDDDDD